nr:retrovirus-related Pol polyprotein from transposon TNT 1-94 [Tanacetum cinerariifolium]
LKSSTSNAQDTCSADALESSGNSNPTATSTNPLDDHMETLAVETPIPTVSSPVPTTCLNDSPEPSSDTILISKRVTSQDDTPSLDNILTLTNRFEDILRVTTNTDNTNGVEADLCNMETTITARPTPTLRIHKDHLKSQIISPMDVKSAFLYGTIDEKVYVMQPPGFQDPEFLARVYKVEKAIYGLHQAPRACRHVATSTTEAEYVVATSGCGQVLWIQNQLLDYGLSMPCEVLSMEISSSILLLIETTEEGTKILATVDGEGSGTPTKPHHTPTPEATPSPQHELSSSSLPPAITESLPTIIPFDNPPLRQYTKRTRIAQSSVLPPVVDEPASPLGDDSQGKACPTGSGFGADQDR